MVGIEGHGVPRKANNMIKSIKSFISSFQTARIMKRLDSEFARLEVLATNRAITALGQKRVASTIASIEWK